MHTNTTLLYLYVCVCAFFVFIRRDYYRENFISLDENVSLPLPDSLFLQFSISLSLTFSHTNCRDTHWVWTTQYTNYWLDVQMINRIIIVQNSSHSYRDRVSWRYFPELSGHREQIMERRVRMWEMQLKWDREERNMKNNRQSDKTKKFQIKSDCADERGRERVYCICSFLLSVAISFNWLNFYRPILYAATNFHAPFASCTNKMQKTFQNAQE